LSKFEFSAYDYGANETLDSVGHQSNRRRHNFALSGGILLHWVAAIVASFHFVSGKIGMHAMAECRRIWWQDNNALGVPCVAVIHCARWQHTLEPSTQFTSKK
jgi:hypothetical protein